MKYSFIVTSESILVIPQDGQSPKSFTSTFPNYQKLRDTVIEYFVLSGTLLAGEEAKFQARFDELMSLASTLDNWSEGAFKLINGQISYNNEPIDPHLSERIVNMLRENKQPKALLNFWQKLQANPSWRSVQQLYKFLQHKGIPLLENGNFLAYKGVNRDFTDKYSASILNNPGRTNRMPRNHVSDDPEVACHYGFHVGDLSYASSFGDLVVICEVNPADVVCVPHDDARKVRVCEYKVIGIHSGEPLDDTVHSQDSQEYQVTYGTFDIEEDEEAEEDVVDFIEKTTTDPKVVNRVPQLPTIKVPEEFAQVHDALTSPELMAHNITILRAYAAKVLHIVGASKIPGGKFMLVQKILQTRDLLDSTQKEQVT